MVFPLFLQPQQRLINRVSTEHFDGLSVVLRDESKILHPRLDKTADAFFSSPSLRPLPLWLETQRISTQVQGTATQSFQSLSLFVSLTNSKMVYSRILAFISHSHSQVCSTT